MSSADFSIDSDQQNGSATSLFGLQLTPPVIGALIAVLGLGAAGYMFTQMVSPVMQKNDELKADLAKKKNDLEGQASIPEKIAQAKVDREKAKQQRNFVTAMFGNEQSVKTLLLDLNKRIEARNTNLKADDVKAKLTRFDPDPGASGFVTDDSLGTQAKNQLYRQVINVELEGTFDQTRLFLIDLERQKNLLTVKNFKTLLDSTFQKIVVDRQQGQIVPVGKPATNLKTSFKLQMLRPLSAEELKLVQQPAKDDKSEKK